MIREISNLQRFSLIKTFFIVALTALFIIIPHSSRAAACVDIGLFVRESGQTVKICAENIAETLSPLRIAKAGVKYGVGLVNPNDPDASKAMIRIPGGITKALKKYVVASIPSNLFPDETHDAAGVQTAPSGPTNFYANFNISNVGNSNTYVFVRTSTANDDSSKVGYSPTTFTVNPNSTHTEQMGRVQFPGLQVSVPDPLWRQGSATYSVRQGSSTGPEVDTVTYTWVYPQ